MPAVGWYEQHGGMPFARLILLTDADDGLGCVAAIIVEKSRGELHLRLDWYTSKQARRNCQVRLPDGPPPVWQGVPTPRIVAQALSKFASLPF